jgi:class 3 adenylate cyclase
MRTETLAIVFTDIKGYTAATSKQTHQEQAALLRRIDRLVAPVVRAFSGRVIKSLGDAYMIVFRSPTEAVRCATAVQDRLHQHNTNIPADKGIHIRISINVGEVRVHRGDVFGEPVNIASRIESVTPADEIYFSEAVYLTMNRSAIATERVGVYELKGIPEPVSVYRVRKYAHAEEASDDSDSDAPTVAAGLPYGGTELGHWRKMRWVRRAYISMWALAVVGLLGAAYLRYRPGVDYDEIVASMKQAIEAEKPIDVLALAGRIPPSAVQERRLARKYRRAAVELLMVKGQLDTAMIEVESLVKEDARDAQALALRGLIRSARRASSVDVIADLGSALELDPELAERDDVIEAIVACYADAAARKAADRLVATTVKNRAVDALHAGLNAEIGDRITQNTMAARLEKLGAGDKVNWVKLAIADLAATSCKTRKSAIARLATEGDATAIGPLIKLADAKTCGSQNARTVAAALRKK